MRALFVSCIIGCLMTCAVPAYSPAVMVGFSTKELKQDSDLIVVGQVEDTESFWSEDGTIIMTRASVVAEDTVMGTTPPERVWVEYEGGTIGEIGLKVSDISPLEKGERVLLFLREGKSRKPVTEEERSLLRKGGPAVPVYSIVGQAQGKYRIDQEGRAKRGGFAAEGDARETDNDLPLDDLIGRIRNLR